MVVDLIHLAEIGFVKFLHCQVTLIFLHFQTVYFLEGSHDVYSQHLKIKGLSRDYTLPPWGQSIYINYLKFSCKRDLSLLSHLLVYVIISFYSYDLMDIYLVFGPITQYYSFLLKLFQLWIFGALSVGSCTLLAYPPNYWFVIFYFLIFWQYKMLKAQLVY